MMVKGSLEAHLSKADLTQKNYLKNKECISI